MTIDLKLSSTHDLLLKDGKLLLTEGASQRAQQIKSGSNIAQKNFSGAGRAEYNFIQS